MILYTIVIILFQVHGWDEINPYLICPVADLLGKKVAKGCKSSPIISNSKAKTAL